ncbi:MAG: efflux RND transporter periplasmic adaptor subunit [Gammaproteobacteria bacterium]|nr:MAG: efflux RND transporter periplasmic adaptor subunit [Gammaproteobacteria bacterium]
MRFLFLFSLLIQVQSVLAGPVLETFVARVEIVDHEQVVSGVIEAVNKATVSAQTDGVVSKLYFDINDYVKKGQVIAEFSNKKQKKELKSAKQAFNQAVSHQQDVAKKIESLRASLSEEEMDDAELATLADALRKAEVRLEETRKKLSQAREALEATLIRAPYSGIVIQTHIQAGEAAIVGQSIVTGVSLDNLRVLSEVPQKIVSSIREYERARIILLDEDVEDSSVLSDIITIFPFANPRTHAFGVRVELPHGVSDLFPGMYVKVAFLVGENTRLLIPSRAVIKRSEVTGVYVQNLDGKVLLRQIRVGARYQPGMIEVLSGLEEGEKVVLNPDELIFPGQDEADSWE